MTTDGCGCVFSNRLIGSVFVLSSSAIENEEVEVNGH